MTVALVVMALVQIGVIIVAIRLGKQVSSAIDEIRREVRPLVEKAHRIAEQAHRISNDAAHATGLALAQVEKVSHLLTTTSTRVGETLGLVQHAVVEPVRQGAAVVAAVRAAVTAFRSWKDSHHSRDDDDALFVG